MPLPHFLILLCAVIVMAALTIWASLQAGVALVVLLIVGLSAVVLLHLGQRRHHDPRS